MPRSARHPVDAVLAYFETAEPAAAEITLHMIRRLVKAKIAAAVAGAPKASPLPVLPSATPRSHKRRGPNKPKVAPPAPLQDVPLPLPTPLAQG